MWQTNELENSILLGCHFSTSWSTDLMQYNKNKTFLSVPTIPKWTSWL